jgi:hypothetical protein
MCFDFENKDDRILKIRGQSRFFGKFGVRAPIREIAPAGKAGPNDTAGLRGATDRVVVQQRRGEIVANSALTPNFVQDVL